MAPIEWFVLILVGIAFVAVCIRTWRKGTCGDCVQGGYCVGHCSPKTKKSCPAVKGVDQVEEELSRGVK